MRYSHALPELRLYVTSDFHTCRKRKLAENKAKGWFKVEVLIRQLYSIPWSRNITKQVKRRFTDS